MNMAGDCAGECENVLDDGFLQDLVAKAAQYLCHLSSEAGIHGTSSGSGSNAIDSTLELIWDVSFSRSASEAMERHGCVQLLWGITFHADNGRVQELCLGALANMCLQSACCSRLLTLPDAAVACMSLCVPNGGLDVSSGSYVQALRLCRVVLGERAAAPLRAVLLKPFLEPQVCRQIVALYPEGRTDTDCELQSALTALAVYVLEAAPDCIHCAQVADSLIDAGLFRAALHATRGERSDVPCIARLLASCQNYSQAHGLCSLCDEDCIAAACAIMLTNSSTSCCSVGMVILANSLRDGALTAPRLLDPPVLVEAVLGYDDLLLGGECHAESEGSDDAEIAAWYVVATMCSAADAALCAAELRDEEPPAFVGALAIQLALSKPFLTATSRLSCESAKAQYVKVAAALALKLTKAAASSVPSHALDHRHPWVYGSDSVEAAVDATGLSLVQLLLLAHEELCRFG